MNKPLVYIVDDETSICRLLEHWVNKWGYKAVPFYEGETYLDKLQTLPEMVLLDLRLPMKAGDEAGNTVGVDLLKETKARYPELPVIILSSHGSIDVAVDTIKLGAVDYFSKPIDLQKLEIAIKNALHTYSLIKELTHLKESLQTSIHFENIISQDSKMQQVFALVQKAKDGDISVFIQGESGTGKELIARALHFNGKRKTGPFIVVNCAAIPKELLESELFGHEKGSFTGAFQRKIGKFEQADKGTLFLDEIGELELSLQAKLLRVLQVKQFERVGGDELLTSDVRIVSATNKDLRTLIKEKSFREDLFYRLTPFPIHLPPLRDRRSDILLIAEHFLKIFSTKQDKPIQGFSRKALKLLFEYPWPGNIRELENVIERAVLIADTNQITEHDLPISIQSFQDNPISADTSSFFDSLNSIVTLAKLEEEAIRHAIRLTEGNMKEAAQRLGLGRSTLYTLLKKYGIETT